jgi:anti-anti-sigma regulatory factor
MQLAFEEKGDVTVVRVQEAKLTYPVLASFFSEVRQRVEGRLLQEKGGALRLSGLQPRVETMISMTGVHKIVPLHRAEEEALAAFGGRRGGGR